MLQPCENLDNRLIGDFMTQLPCTLWGLYIMDTLAFAFTIIPVAKGCDSEFLKIVELIDCVGQLWSA